jgi:hypothetical protein
MLGVGCVGGRGVVKIFVMEIEKRAVSWKLQPFE